MFGLDGFEINKIAGAILASVLAVFAINEIGGILVHPTEIENAAYVPDGTEQFEAGAAPVVVEDEGPVSSLPLLASADPGDGEKVFKKCTSCHTIDDGMKDGTGPHLYGVVGRDKAAVAGFGYSNGLTEMGGSWTYEALDAFLRKPKDYVKGTKMSFAGLKKPKDRAAVIAYMAANSPGAPAFPAVEATPVEEAAEAVEDAVEAVTEQAQDVMDDHGAGHGAADAGHH